MKALKIVAVLMVGYICVIVTFESLLGYFQPGGQSTLSITTTDTSGAAQTRVVVRLVSDGNLYVAANHWPRAWYHQALANPKVLIGFFGQSEPAAPYLATLVTGAEQARVAADNPTSFGFRLLTGFPPRYFLRLDPASDSDNLKAVAR
jgi:hypothetical protein